MKIDKTFIRNVESDNKLSSTRTRSMKETDEGNRWRQSTKIQIDKSLLEPKTELPMNFRLANRMKKSTCNLQDLKQKFLSG